MITPKEQAIELVNKFLNYTPIKLSDYTRVYYPSAKEFALIANDEVLSYSKSHGFISLTEYLEEVKQEINNL